jgi:hypothetical protein
LVHFGIVYDHFVHIYCVHLVHFSGFGNTYQEKSGNPAADRLETESSKEEKEGICQSHMTLTLGLPRSIEILYLKV